MIQREMMEYQELDVQLRRMKRDIEKNPFFVQGKQLTAALREADEAIGKLDARAGDLRTALQGIKQKTEEISKQLEIYEKDVSDIQNRDELNYLKKKMASPSETLAAAERESRNVMREAEELSQKYEELKAKLPKLKANYAKCNEEFNKITAEAQPKINSIKKAQAELEKHISLEIFEIYKKVRSQNVSPVFVELMDGERCGGCRMNISGSSVSKIDEAGYIRCEHCGRIIYKA